MNFRRAIQGVLAAGAVALSVSLVGCGSSAAADKTIFLGQVNPPITFNPLNAPDIASQYDQTIMMDSLLDFVEPLKFLPKLADTFELKDPTTISIALNPKAQWTDGQPVTSDDVAFTLNLIANPATETALGTYLAPLAGLTDKFKLPEGQTSMSAVKIVDPTHLEITLKTPLDVNMIKEQLGVNVRILPKHILGDADPATLAQNPYFQNPTVTSGPYSFVKYEKDQYVEYAANPKYYRGAPKIAHLFVKLIPATNMVSQLQTGEITFNTGLGIGLIPSTDFDAAKALTNVRTKIEPNTSVQMMAFNVETLKDPRVRQAIAYAIDRPSILSKLLKGSGETIDPPYTSLNPYLAKDIPTYDYNPSKAMALLAEAKWDMKTPINLVVPIGNKDREQSANIIAQNLTDIGLTVNMTKFDFPTIMQKGKKHEFDLLLIGNNFLIDPDGISTMLTSTAPLNFAGWKNTRVDDLFAQGKAEPDPTKRMAIYHEIQQNLHDDMPLLTLYSYQELMAISKKLTKGEPRFFGTFYDVNQWDVEP